MANRSHDWLRQALRDFEQAKDSRAGDRHEWACFAAQQAAGKAVKALHLANGQEAWGQVVAKLLKQREERIYSAGRSVCRWVIRGSASIDRDSPIRSGMSPSRKWKALYPRRSKPTLTEET